MNQILFPVNLTTKKDSNLFLRALWAEFRIQFGRCAWQFMPINNRKKGIVSLGNMSLGTGNAIEVLIRYKKRGIIQAIELIDVGGEHLPEKVLAIIKKILNNYKHSITDYQMFTFVKFMCPMAYYELSHLSIIPLENDSNIIRMSVNAYDEKDAKFVFKKKLNAVIDILTTCIWTSVTFSKEGQEDIKEKKNNLNTYLDDIEININDEVCVNNGQYYLTAKSFVLMNKVVAEDDLSRAIQNFLAAARLYKNGVKLEDLSRQAIGQGIDYTEMVVVSYMSSLEVLAADSEVKYENCAECGQQKFSIAKRVKDLAEKASEGNIFFVNEVRKFYNNRSKFLHEGSFMSEDRYMGSSIPQLSDNDEGVEHQMYYLIDLRFRAGQVFHWVIQNSF